MKADYHRYEAEIVPPE